MSKEKDFINKIAPIVVKFSKQYGYKYPSAVIAQMCLESAYGSSELAVNAYNFSGLKYKSSVTSEYYIKQATEQRADGSYYTVNNTKWCKFNNMDEGVEGYFKFINNTRYANLKDATSSKNYLELIKADGYATSLKYVDNVYNVVIKFNLEKFDEVEEVKNSPINGNSPLIDGTLISQNKTIMTNKVNRKIVIHHMSGVLSAKRCGEIFQNPSRKASSNYGIGKDGEVFLYVDEKDRSWCSSSKEIDSQAITIECSNSLVGGNWPVSNKVYNKLIELCVDICKRNGIKELTWTGDKNGTLVCHYMFASTSCPGPFLKSKMPEIAKEVTKRLNPNYQEPILEDKEITYIVQKGDTLSKIAQKFNTNFVSIQKLNNIKNPNLIYVGQELRIKTKGEKEETETYKTYVVQPSDSLWKIAKNELNNPNRYNELISINGLKSTVLQVGQILKIPKK